MNCHFPAHVNMNLDDRLAALEEAADAYRHLIAFKDPSKIAWWTDLHRAFHELQLAHNALPGKGVPPARAGTPDPTR